MRRGATEGASPVSDLPGPIFSLGSLLPSDPGRVGAPCMWSYVMQVTLCLCHLRPPAGPSFTGQPAYQTPASSWAAGPPFPLAVHRESVCPSDVFVGQSVGLGSQLGPQASEPVRLGSTAWPVRFP